MMAQWLRLLRLGSWYRCAMAMPYSSAVAANKRTCFKNKGHRIHTKLLQQPNLLNKLNLLKPGTDQDHLLIIVFKSNTKKINRPAHSCNIKPAKELTSR
jgi:hypothetical protein